MRGLASAASSSLLFLDAGGGPQREPFSWASPILKAQGTDRGVLKSSFPASQSLDSEVCG